MIPDASTTVYIGAAGTPHLTSVGTAQVFLNTAGTADTVFVGPGVGNSGMLTLQPDGSLTATNLYLGSLGGNASLNLGAQQVTLSSVFFHGGGTTVTREVGGSITAAEFNIQGGSSFTMGNGDSFTGTGYVVQGSTMTTSGPMSLTSGLNVDGAGSMFNAGSTFSASGTSVSDNATFNANGNVNVSVMNMDNSGTLNLNGNTLTTTNLSLGNAPGGPVIINRGGGNISTNSIQIYNANSLTYEMGDNFTTSVLLQSGSTLSLNKDLTLTSGLQVRTGSTLNLNSHTLNVNALQLRESSILTRSAGSLIVAGGLYVSGNIDLPSLAGDEVSIELILGGNQAGVVTVTQFTDDLTGLSLLNSGNALSIDPNTSSVMNLVFDGGQTQGVLDWAFRWAGDHETVLNSMLGSQILVFGAPETVSVIRDVGLYGDFTYIGYVSAVPEPNSVFVFVTVWGMIALGVRRKTKRV
jgi:hypothetical protein